VKVGKKEKTGGGGRQFKKKKEIYPLPKGGSRNDTGVNTSAQTRQGRFDRKKRKGGKRGKGGEVKEKKGGDYLEKKMGDERRNYAPPTSSEQNEKDTRRREKEGGSPKGTSRGRKRRADLFRRGREHRRHLLVEGGKTLILKEYLERTKKRKKDAWPIL